MRRTLSALTLLLSGLFAAGSASAATNPHVTAHPTVRLTAKIDNTKTFVVGNTHSPLVTTLPDLGRVAPDTKLPHMTLMLKPTDDQEYALESLLDQQQDKNSPNYHQWMTPEGMGAAFGVAPEDIATISTWLTSQGFTVDSVPKSARYIVFTGTSSQVESAFHTEMHTFQVDGITRMANVTDISMPKALASVAVGVRLNNFLAHSNMVNKQKVSRGADGQLHRLSADGIPTPETTLGSSHYVGAADLATIYDLNPLFAKGNDGTGVKIAILGQTDILLGDIATYRSIFGLKPNTPNFIQIGQDPGTIADEGESDLDVELSGAFAPGATIDFYLSGNSYFGGGISASGFYVAENNSDDIMSLSYGEAESSLGAAGNAQFNFLWEQAAAQGISCFVSSGDSGPDTLRDGSTTASTYNVSGLASTPFNVAVGGTMFNDTVGGPFWSTTNNPTNNLSALSYIPELPWNEGTLDPFGNVAFGYGTTASIVAESSGISIEYGRPAWQTGPGIPSASDPTPPIGTVSGFLVPAPHRILPDVALEAAAYDDGTLFCSGGVCNVGPGNVILDAGIVGGTSVAAPSMAGTQALINQLNGGRQGLPTYYYYRVAALQSTTGCNSATYVTTSTAPCGFHDIQTGNNFVPTANGGTVANGKYIGWSAGTSFDVAIGLGSPDVTQLATNWKNITFNATTTSFTLTPTTIVHGATQNFTIAVAPASGTGTPTGDVSIIAQSTAPYGAIGFVTLASGVASGTITSATLEALPAGTYKVYAHYAGDTVFGGSNSPAITVTVTTGTDSISVTPYNLAVSGALTPTTTYTYGSNVYFNAQVCDPAGLASGLCSSGTPTGTITYTLNNGTANLPGVVGSLDSFDVSYYDSGQGFSAYDINPTYSILPAGTYTVATQYSGDATFPAVAGTPFTIVIGPTTPTFTVTAVTATIPSAGTAIINAAVSQFTQSRYAVTATTAAFPTGTVTFTDSVNGLLGTATLSPLGTVSTVAFTTNKITTAGAHTVTAVYSGDANYATSTKTVTITVGGTVAPTPVVTFTIAGVAATTSQVGVTTVVVCSVATPATGTVAIYDTGVLLGTGTLSTTLHSYSLTVRNLTAGTHQVSCVYEGSTTLDSSTSATTPLVVAQNLPTLYITTGNSTAAATQGVGINSVLTPTPENAFPMNPPPTGSVNFYDGATLLGSALVVADPAGYDTYANSFNTKALKPGPHTLLAKYPGDANYAGATSNSQVINIGLTTTAISAYPTTVGVNYLFSLSATITPVVSLTSNPAVGGTVSFYAGSTLLGTATVTNGVGTLKAAALTTLGANSVTAVYSGDTNYYTSTSAPVIITAVTPTVTFSVTPSSLTIIRGQAGSASMTITTTGDFTGTLNFSCSGLPAYSYCNFPPTVVAPASGAYGTTGTLTQTVAMTVATTAPTPEYAGGLLWIPALFFAGFLLVRRKQLSGRTRNLIALAVIFCGVAALSGCGGNIPHTGVQNGTPLGQASITVNIAGVGTTSVGSPNITGSAPLTINVVAQ